MSAFDLESAARAIMPKEILTLATSSHLALHIAPSYVQAQVSDAATEKRLWHQTFALNHPEQLDQGFAFVQARNWLDKVFRRVTLSFESPYFTLVPEPLYAADHMDDLLRFNFPSFAGQARQLELRESDSRVVFEWPTAANELLKNAPHLQLMPLAFLMARFAHHPQWNESTQINLLVGSTRLFVTATRNFRLLFLNSFDVSNEMDVLYHLSNLAIRLELDLERVPVMVMHQTGSMSVNVLETYCGAIQSPKFDESAGAILQLHSICA
jgi:hypothetical protein